MFQLSMHCFLNWLYTNLTNTKIFAAKNWKRKLNGIISDTQIAKGGIKFEITKKQKVELNSNIRRRIFIYFWWV